MLSFKQFLKETKEVFYVNGHPMVNIDGKMHHVNTSKGVPIHNTIEGIKNFHKWFGKSKTVDEHGRPHVFYHGTSSDIDQFHLTHTGKGNDQYGSGFYLTNSPEKASYYASASTDYHYTGDKPKSSNVIPAYVSIKKPINKDSERPLSMSHLHALITSAPNHKESLDGNWGEIDREGYHKVLKNAISAYKDMAVFHAMNSIHNDFYQGHSEQFLTNFKKITKYDGVITDKGDIITAFSPHQIKSSIGNKGTFNKRNPELTESN